MTSPTASSAVFLFVPNKCAHWVSHTQLHCASNEALLMLLHNYSKVALVWKQISEVCHIISQFDGTICTDFDVHYVCV